MPAKPPASPVAVYARISSDRTGKQAGVKRQLADCAKLASLQRLDVVETIVENDTSAYRKKRIGFEKLKTLALEGKIIGVVAYDSDRLYRSISDLESMITVVESAPRGFQIHSVNNGDINLNSASGKAMARVLAGLGQYEVEHKAQRQASAQKAAAKVGKFGGGVVPTGYKLGPEPGTLVIDEPMAEKLREVANLITRDHWKITAATRWFREHTDRKKIKPVTLRGILTGGPIVGVRSYLPVEAKRRGFTKPKVSKAQWEPIITKKQWYALKRELKTTERGRPATASVLSGAMMCAICGTTLGYSSASYKCPFTAGGCAGVSISTKTVERNILLGVKGTLQKSPEYLAAVFGLGKVDPVADVSSERAEIEEERAEILYFRSKKTITFEECDAQLDALKVREEELDSIEAKSAQTSVRQQQLSTSYATWTSLGNTQADTATRNRVIRGMYPEIVIYPVGRNAGSKFNADRVEARVPGSPDFIPFNKRVGWDIDHPNPVAFLPNELLATYTFEEFLGPAKRRAALDPDFASKLATYMADQEKS